VGAGLERGESGEHHRFPLPDYGYRASGDSKPDPRFDPGQPGRIGLKGRRVGDVRRVADVTPSFEHLFTTQRGHLTPSGPPQLRLQEWAMSLEDLRASNGTSVHGLSSSN
jgi:hypothetical protein